MADNTASQTAEKKSTAPKHKKDNRPPVAPPAFSSTPEKSPIALPSTASAATTGTKKQHVKKSPPETKDDLDFFDYTHMTKENVKVTKRVALRNCYNVKKHNAHVHYSHIFQVECFCDGSGKTPPAAAASAYSTGTTTYVKKKDYSTGWRDEYVTPIRVSEARKIAYDMHKSDKDKSGEAYWKHLEAVCLGVVVLGGSPEEQIAALFHDAVEDLHTTYDMLRKIGCTDHTIDMIEAVSKRSSEEQNKYLARIIECGPGAMRVKLADLLHNTRHDRMEAVAKAKGEYTRDRLLKKYRPAIARLMLELGIIVDEDEQKKLATKPIGTATSTYYSGGSSTGTKTSTTQYAVTSLIGGDWPTLFRAPILRKLHNNGQETTFLLANGEIVTEKHYTGQMQRKLSTYGYHQWSSSSAILPNHAATEEDILEFLDAINKEKDRLSGGSSTYGPDNPLY